MSCTLLVPGTAGSASRDSTSIRASGAGRGVIGAASSGLDVTGGSDGAGGDERLNSGCEHPESPDAATMVAAPRVTRMFRRIQRHARLPAACECSRSLGGGRRTDRRVAHYACG